ncbi:DUF3616 domain-containing protein [Kovacikia minuta CCNUW1]|uniref:DUF3616 domain-containing protein n=1 Tax=Kovacikia minuta TaxID=2931930 RepID=UPI001CCB9EDD|nr:DUF3616 domain-containing protein [Kovacikia minuta]UBF26430.1 DUF3616 domain-containing protein [Kovacikia minuta CCNUW1]
MPTPFLLSRVLLRFNDKSEDLLGQLSAVTLTPDGSCWVGSDELNTIERLSPVEPYIFGNHRSFVVNDFIPLVNQEDEIDIEGFGYFDSYLWITGSHSQTRGKPKGKNPEKDIRRLAEIKPNANRFLIARIPVVKGELYQSCPHPDDPGKTLTAACVQLTKAGNLLTEVLQEDSHLGHYVAIALPSKENGFDVEGLAVHKNTLFLGLRGPVLRGWAIILEIEVEELEPGVLTLKTIGEDGRKYKKHFVDLNGLGIRELCFCKKDLIILAGPTMQLEVTMRVFRLKDLLHKNKDSMTGESSDDLEVLFDLPLTIGSDHAEGASIFPCLGQKKALLVVYDAPDATRRIEPDAILADVFLLE